MMGIDELIGCIAGLDRAEVVRWVDNRWILPDEDGGRWQFREVDIARIELIRDIRREFAIDDEVMPLLLALLDQIYSLRRQMRRLSDALESQPQEVRDAIGRALRG
jgi:chaperone modulatory protein CbpM